MVSLIQTIETMADCVAKWYNYFELGYGDPRKLKLNCHKKTTHALQIGFGLSWLANNTGRSPHNPKHRTVPLTNWLVSVWSAKWPKQRLHSYFTLDDLGLPAIHEVPFLAVFFFFARGEITTFVIFTPSIGDGDLGQFSKEKKKLWAQILCNHWTETTFLFSLTKLTTNLSINLP